MFYLGNRNFFNIQSIKIMETNMKIMVVDDNEFSALSLKIMLDPAGHKTEIFKDPLRALEHYKQHHYDVVVSDFYMPGLSGLELVEKIKELDPLASLTLVSGENLSKRHENFNSIKIFKKPFDVQEFMQYIDSCG